MSRRLLVAALLLVALQGCFLNRFVSFDTAESQVTSATACRAAFPDAAMDPGAIGGYYLDPQAGRLCLYGTLEELDPQEISDALTTLLEPQPLRLVVRSAGGPVDVWLSLAEMLGPLRPDLVIDEACLSSCAVYAAPIARHIAFATEGLLAWHGGPNLGTSAIEFGLDHGGYGELAQRTERLYRAHGVSARLLSDTTHPPSWSQTNLVIETTPRANQISGYAIRPETLRGCYGLEAARDLWHPGDDRAVLRRASSFADRLALLEYPGTVARCDR